MCMAKESSPEGFNTSVLIAIERWQVCGRSFDLFPIPQAVSTIAIFVTGRVGMLLPFHYQ